MPKDYTYRVRELNRSPAFALRSHTHTHAPRPTKSPTTATPDATASGNGHINASAQAVKKGEATNAKPNMRAKSRPAFIAAVNANIKGSPIDKETISLSGQGSEPILLKNLSKASAPVELPQDRLSPRSG